MFINSYQALQCQSGMTSYWPYSVQYFLWTTCHAMLGPHRKSWQCVFSASSSFFLLLQSDLILTYSLRSLCLSTRAGIVLFHAVCQLLSWCCATVLLQQCCLPCKRQIVCTCLHLRSSSCKVAPAISLYTWHVWGDTWLCEPYCCLIVRRLPNRGHVCVDFFSGFPPTDV